MKVSRFALMGSSRPWLALGAAHLLTACASEDPAFTNQTLPAVSAANDVTPDDEGIDGRRRTEDNAAKGTEPKERSERSEAPTLSFSLWQDKTESGTLQLDRKRAQHNLVVEELKTRETAKFKQVVLPELVNVFQQGREGDTKHESFQQSEAGVIDLLVIVDSSGSMKEEQANLSTKLRPLLSSLASSDWRIAVTTTDPQDGCLRALIQKGQADAEAAFAQAVSPGLDGSSNEQGIRQAVGGLSCSSTPWLRESSTVAVLVVSDEDNCSNNGKGCERELWGHEDYLFNHLSQNLGRKIGEDARVYGLIRHPSDISCKTAANPAPQYARAVARSGGTWGSICHSDYTSTLSRISKDVSTILKSQFALASTPSKETIKVKVTQTDGQSMDWPHFTVADKVITFSKAPPKGSSIDISYETPSEPQEDSFTLANNPWAQSVVVRINGEVVDPSSYDLNGRKLGFLVAPPASASITVSYLHDLPLESAFSVGANAIPSSIEVSVNGTKESQIVYDVASGSIIFSAPPQPGAEVDIAFERSRGLRLSYPSPVKADDIDDIKALRADGSEIPVRLKPGSEGGDQSESGTVVSLDSSAGLQPGDVVTLDIRRRSGLSGELTLPSVPFAGSLELETSSASCALEQGITVDDRVIKVDCPEAEELVLNYSYRSKIPEARSFDVSKLLDAPDRSAQDLVVSFDGQGLLPQGAFTIKEGQLILLPEAVPPTAKALIVAQAASSAK